MKAITTCLICLSLLPALAGCGSDVTVPPAGSDRVVVDDAPPAIPTGLSAVPGETIVKLGWQPNTTDLDLLGYNVYRICDGRLILLTDTPIDKTVYCDRKPWPQSNLYAVTSVDIAGNESAWAAIAVYCEQSVPVQEPADQINPDNSARSAPGGE